MLWSCSAGPHSVLAGLRVGEGGGADGAAGSGGAAGEGGGVAGFAALQRMLPPWGHKHPVGLHTTWKWRWYAALVPETTSKHLA